ncbi:MAG: inorganic phosphate transporter [Candidatus Sericytochromatia bacterium]|nr:inorganic phosphate transporter [Candidatus Sericytochromatia bacterium]
MSMALILLATIVALALFFDFINGFHDTANAIACSVSTRVLTPAVAIALAASMNLFGALVSTKVAATIGKGILVPAFVTPELVIAALLSAIGWNLLTWWWGLPSSSSHALIGGVAGAGFAAGGAAALKLDGLLKIVQSLLGSPLLGFVLGAGLMLSLYLICRCWAPGTVRQTFRPMQVLAAAFISFTHGMNDAQKSMGVILLALIGAGALGGGAEVPLWVKLSCAIAMAGGTAVGGWKIIKTMGTKIVKLQPINGFAADFTSASVILGASSLGLPVSTTHVAASSILGVGSTRRLSAVRWGVAGTMVLAWIFTIPITFTLSAGMYGIVKTLQSSPAALQHASGVRARP